MQCTTEVMRQEAGGRQIAELENEVRPVGVYMGA